jgi:phospholipase/lecithinase/hemolysin
MMIKRDHWAVPGFSVLALLSLAACGGGGSGGGGSGGIGGTPSTGTGGPSTPPPVVDFSTPNPYATYGSDTPDKLGTLHVFGDSYSDANTTRVAANEVWSRRLVDSKPGATLNSFARDGASAVDGGVYGDASNDFKSQVDQWSATKSLGANDLTVVYMGYNDVNMRSVPELGTSAADYGTHVNRLIGEGATSGDRRLFLTLLHDFGDTPGEETGGAKSTQTVAMNNGIAAVVNGKSNVVAVDMFTVFNRIKADPARYGLANVTDVPGGGDDAGKFLYTDGHHFGARGQEIVAQVYNHYLTRGWDLANALQGSTANKDKLNNDVDNRLAELSLVDGTAKGLTSFFVGNDRAGSLGTYDVEIDDPARSGFAALTQGGGRMPASG